MSNLAQMRDTRTLEIDRTHAAIKKTARVTGLWYLALGIAGMLGFLIVRPTIVAEGDAAATLANLVDNESLARLGLAAEMAVVVAQTLAAIWFYKLFRGINHVAAWALAIFGVGNAMAIMASSVFVATALTVAGDPGLAVGGDAGGTVQLMYELSASSWGVGGIFFGLWLIPMGYVVVSSGRMPLWLGRILIVGGGAYLLSAFLGYGIADAPTWLVDGLPYLATVGEFWMIGYLLILGIRPATQPAAMSADYAAG
jgi:hypothetical protein